MLAEMVSFFARRAHHALGTARRAGEDMPVSDLGARLRVAVAGGSALPVEVHRRFETTFGVTILEGYGLSETSPVASFSPVGQPARPCSIGTPIGSR
jgi:long-chain acyl-CoA synthetase